MDALLFLSRALGACTNKPTFVWEGGPWYSWAFRELGLEHCHGAFGDGGRLGRGRVDRGAAAGAEPHPATHPQQLLDARSHAL